MRTCASCVLELASLCLQVFNLFQEHPRSSFSMTHASSSARHVGSAGAFELRSEECCSHPALGAIKRSLTKNRPCGVQPSSSCRP
eukprot:1195110-Prorocentrum_minimum.AAC.3